MIRLHTLRGIQLPSVVTGTIAIALLLGIGFRCLGLEHKLFWVDEVYTTLNVAGYSNRDAAALFTPPRLTTAAELLAPLTTGNGLAQLLQVLTTEETTHVPLYYVFTYGWVNVWGHAIAAFRSVAVLFSLLALGSFYFLARALFRSPLVAALAMALMAVSPFHVLYAQEARPYSLWLWLTVLSSWLLVRSRSRPSWQSWGGYGLTVSLGLYTFLYMPLVLLAQGIYLLGVEKARWTPVVKRYALATLGGVLSFVPWLMAIAPHRANLTGNTRWQVQAATASPGTLLHNLGLTLARGFIDFDGNYGFSPKNWWPYGLVVIAAVALVGGGMVVCIRHAPIEQWLLPCLLLVVPMGAIAALEVVTGQQQSSSARYFTPCYVGAELMVAYALGRLIQNPNKSRMGMIIVSAVLAIGALSCGNGAIAPSGWHKAGHYIPPAAAIMGQSDRPLVLLDSDAWSLALAHALPPATPVLPFNSGQVVPDLPRGYSSYFIAHVPEDWASAYQAATGYSLQFLKNLDNVPVWHIIPE